MILRPQPVARGVATLLAVAGTLAMRELLALAIAWAAVFAVAALSRIRREHLRFVAGVVLPIGVVLATLWGGMIAAAPGEIPGSAPMHGCAFAATTTLRVAVLGGVVQLCVATVDVSDVPGLLGAWGIRGRPRILIVSSIVLLPELRRRADQILTARLARGLVGSGNWWSSWLQLPHLVRPLVACTLRSALHRAEMWHTRALLASVDGAMPVRAQGTPLGSAVTLSSAACWLLYGVVTLC